MPWLEVGVPLVPAKARRAWWSFAASGQFGRTQGRFGRGAAFQPVVCAGYSAAGEALNCDIWSIAVRAAVDLGADKLFCLTVPESQPFSLPAWVPVSDAEALLNRLVVQHQSWDDFQAPVVPHRRVPPAAESIAPMH